MAAKAAIGLKGLKIDQLYRQSIKQGQQLIPNQ